jgi:3-oxoacyl-[acyl-carrier protein] reductase
VPIELGLEGKAAAITGGSEGLGRAIAERLSREGAQVAICARRADVLRNAAAEIERATRNAVLAFPADMAEPTAAQRFVDAAAERFGRLDILVNNAGVGTARPFEALSDDDWAQDFEVKVFAAARCTRLAIPHMRRHGGGRIVNIVNTTWKFPGAGRLPTAAARAADVALMKAVAQEYAAENILVNAVNIGFVRSMQWEPQRLREAPDQPADEYYRAFARRRGIPVGRVAEASELADLVAYLVSERASYITGTAINFDGGFCPVP